MASVCKAADGQIVVTGSGRNLPPPEDPMLRPAFTPEAWGIMDQILRLGFVVEFASVESFDGCQGPVAIYDSMGFFVADFGPRDRRTVPTVAHLRKAIAAAKKEAAKYEEWDPHPCHHSGPAVETKTKRQARYSEGE